MRRFFVPAILLLLSTRTLAADQNVSDFVQGIKPFISAIAGRAEKFDLSGTIKVPIDGKSQEVDLSVIRYDSESFDLTLNHADYAVAIRRRSDVTAFAVPKHHVVFVGTGDVEPDSRLSSTEISSRLLSDDSSVAQARIGLALLSAGDISQTLESLLANTEIVFDASTKSFSTGDVSMSFPGRGQLEGRSDKYSVQLSLSITTELKSAPSATDWPGMTTTELPRAEIERTIVRGVRRAMEILQPGSSLTKPNMKPRKTDHGELRWVDGQRVCLLWGTPEQIGMAHGELLPEESRRCIESVLYTFGMVNTVRTGRWFRHDLGDAYSRLSPHIPERHKRETQALAAALGLEPEIVEVLNVFPELFHCSGFAVFGSATTDGKLYHGRVLDYMTTIGLQDSATTFIVRPEGYIPFANVGYAAFIGSVSGMNAEKISLGEMGGRGEGKWDGAPMATLMRRAMEECDTLSEVQELWTKSPRTCEYYYVFADGEINDAVGCAATPDSVEFIKAGQSHERLGDGIRDAVVLSAGSRLEELRKRVTEKHGKIDADLGQWLMSRPVAMESNLHNVLFVPADGVLYIANASHKKPAAEMPYVKVNLPQLISEMPQSPIKAPAVSQK
ncbi:MAG: C45 family autoproteolytic acyltransferase/hydrolase [Planctomycetota bacterium]